MEVSVQLPEWTNAKTLIMSGGMLSDIIEAMSLLTKEQCETMCVKKNFEHFEYCSFDLLHYAIYRNRRDVVDHIFTEGLFSSSFTTNPNNSLPYLHMACILGYMDIFDLIIQHRPHEKSLLINKTALYWWGVKLTMRMGKYNKCIML